jgi:hypothetical protein
VTIPKKGSRRITVDGSEYRWLIRRKPTYSQANGWTPMILAISSSEPQSSSLVVAVAATRPDAWVGAGNTAITPHAVAELIRLAVVRGWDPTSPGSPFLLDAQAETLFNSVVPSNTSLERTRAR